MFEVTLGDGVSFYAVARRPFVFWGIVRAEKSVEQREMNGKVYIDGFALDAVVPVVKTRRYEKIFDEREPPVQV